MRIKICGITNLEDALAACEAGADALGFNFSEEAKAKGRYIAPDKAREIIEKLPPFVTTVAVTINETVAQLKSYLAFVDRVQLHGEETPETSNKLGQKAIKVFQVGVDFDVESMRLYAVASYLLDASVPGRRGGTGETADWESASKAAAVSDRVILAGGLTPENVADAVRIVGPYGVDTASGVERAPGKKDHDKIFEFVRNAKAPLS